MLKGISIRKKNEWNNCDKMETTIQKIMQGVLKLQVQS